MSGPPRQQIRPGVDELRRLPPEYDITDEDEFENDPDDVPTYAPAASTSRSLPPPVIGTESSSTGNSILKSSKRNNDKKAKSVRIASESNTENEGKSGNEGRHQRFIVPLDDEDDETSRNLEGHNDHVTDSLPSLAPVFGTIQERKPLERMESSAATKKSERVGTSRFAARRQLDRDAGIAKPVHQGYPVAKKIPPMSEQSDEIWLDEDGNPMSAFRKSRLMKEGKQPPSTRAATKEEPVGTHSSTNQTKEDTLSGMDALLRSISAENEAKVSAMSAEEVEHDLQDIRETFGSNLLEMLKNRHKKNTDTSDLKKASQIAERSSDVSQSPSSLSRNTSETQGTPAYIRQKYFTNEPEALPSALKWTQDMPLATEKDSENQRFDFTGHLIRPQADENATHLAGLHHHGDEQEKPGYTVKELIHLARSTLSSQRVLALQTLARIASVYPEVDTDRIPLASLADDGISRDVMKSNLRGQSCVIASWYIEDRQINVRSAALACIKACLSSTLVGPDPLFLVELPTLKSANQNQNHQVELSIHQSEKEERPKLPSVHDSELHEVLVEHLLRFLCFRDMSAYESLTSWQILLHISKRSRRICKTICRDFRVVSEIFTKYLLKQSWSENSNESEASLLALELMLCLIATSREVALSIAFKDFTLKLIRFIAIPPWSAPAVAQPSSWRHMNLSLQIFANFARYGIGADMYSNSHSAFIEMEQWIRHFKPDPNNSPLRSIKLQTLHSALVLLSNWTVCASDAHQTYGQHDITWSQVSEWGEIGLAVLQNNEEEEIKPEEVEVLQVQGEAFRLLQVWRQGVEINRPDDLQKYRSDNNIFQKHTNTFLSKIHCSLTYYLSQLSSNHNGKSKEPFCLSQIAQVKKIAELSNTTSSIVGFNEQHHISSPDLDAIIRQLLDEVPWHLFQSEEAIQAGIAGPQRQIIEFVYHALISAQNGGTEVEYWQDLLASLPHGSEEIAQNILLKHIPAQLGKEGSEEIKILSPFLKELVRLEHDDSMAPLWPTISSLKSSNTLFLICQNSSQDQEEETDPLSGAPLWKCVNHGLPLRKDWPIAALDDLLHSGNCAALNRPNALSNEWDANELQIVQSSLSLGIRLWQKGLTSGNTSMLPSASEIQLGVMKVFMLEEEQQQAANVRASGKITGRDIYRDEKVSDLLSQYFELANKISIVHEGKNKDDLEQVCQRQFGISLPFYQFYTSLVGLYDGISFGMELFGRAILIPLQMQYAAEYRRLVWVDYAHYLSTIVTREENAPNGLRSFICEEEMDDSIIRGMAMSLLSGHIENKRNGLLFAIATQQLARIIWTKQTNDHHKQKAERLVKTLFHRRDNGAHDSEIPHIQAMRKSILEWKGEEEDSNILSRDERLRLIERN